MKSTEESSGTILIVEDEAAIRSSVADGLRLDGHRVLEAATLSEGRELCGTLKPALILLDVRLPDGSGLDLLGEVRSRGEPVFVLVLTARGTEEDRVLGFEHGCDDYLVKPFSLKELKLRVAALLRRGPPRDCSSAPRPFTIGTARVDLQGYRVDRAGKEFRLSPKERDMIALFVQHPGVVLSRERFLNDVWGYERFPTTRTVDMHILKLRHKLENDIDHPRHIITVHGAGYRFDP